MERDGWIQRVPAESDRRKKLIRPTPRVQPLWEKMVQCAHRVRARATRGLTPAQLNQLHDLLEQVRTNLGQTGE
jgi:DNA-binding MarR family transcriptional regulator